MNLMKACFYLIVALASLDVPPAAFGEDNQPPFLGPSPSPELQVFAPLVGNWSVKTVARPSIESKEGQTGTGEMKGQWLHNGHFLRLEGFTDVKSGRLEYSILLSYDRNQKVYRRWAFTSSGTAAESTGRWDETMQTMTWTNKGGTPTASYVVKQVIEKDRFVDSHLQKREDGATVRDFTVTAERKKEAKK
jgi:hypothetical protein